MHMFFSEPGEDSSTTEIFVILGSEEKRGGGGFVGQDKGERRFIECTKRWVD